MPVTCPNCGGAHPRWECKMPEVLFPPKPLPVIDPDKVDKIIRKHIEEVASPNIPRLQGEAAADIVMGLPGDEERAAYRAYMKAYMRAWRAKRKPK